MNKKNKIFIAGHQGMVGSYVVCAFNKLGLYNLLLRSRSELDLTMQEIGDIFFKQEKLEYVIVAVARVGGIVANNTLPC